MHNPKKLLCCEGSDLRKVNGLQHIEMPIICDQIRRIGSNCRISELVVIRITNDQLPVEVRGDEAVSYTHLDVYKRQDEGEAEGEADEGQHEPE